MIPKTKSKMLGPEFATVAGNEDASIHEAILDNPEADWKFQDAAIRRTVAGGMSLHLALRLYGNTIRSR